MKAVGAVGGSCCYYCNYGVTSRTKSFSLVLYYIDQASEFARVTKYLNQVDLHMLPERGVCVEITRLSAPSREVAQGITRSRWKISLHV